MTLYAVFRAIGLSVEVLPIHDGPWGIGGVDHTLEPVLHPDLTGEVFTLDDYRKTGRMPRRWPYHTDSSSEDPMTDELTLSYQDPVTDFSKDFKSRLETLLYMRTISGVECKRTPTAVGHASHEHAVNRDDPESHKRDVSSSFLSFYSFLFYSMNVA